MVYYDLSFHTHTQKTATLICDSIGEHVKHIPNCQYFLQVYPGTRIEDLDYFISPGSASVNFKIVLIYVGTNRINSCKLADFGYYYNRLISTIRKPSTKVITLDIHVLV